MLVFVFAAIARAAETPRGTMLVIAGSADAGRSLAPLLDFRRQQGWNLKTTVLDRATTASIMRVIGEHDTSSSHSLTHLLLVGSDRALPMVSIPNRPIQRVDDSPAMPTDQPYGLSDARGIPRLAVGRIPADDAATLSQFARKIVDYETEIAKVQPVLLLIAGREYADSKPIFAGLSAQNLVDGIAAAWIDELRAKPYAFKLRAHTAFPGRDYFPPERAVAVFSEDIDARPFLTVYAGHANRDLFATNHDAINMAPLNRNSIAAISFKSVSGPFFSGGCSMIEPGDAPSLGEMLAMGPRGPVAFIGYTGINDDFCVMQALETMAASLSDIKSKTIGEAVRDWKGMMITQPQTPRSRMDQFFMNGDGQFRPDALPIDYGRALARNNALLNLIGDPATTLAVPRRATN